MQTVSFQLYSARDFQPFSAVFRILAEAGYKQVEGYGALYAALDDAAILAVKADLDANGLTMPTAHFSLDMLESEPERVLAICRTLGIVAVYCPYLLPEDRPTDAAGWRAFGERLQKAGEPICKDGLTFGWHNHDFEFFTLSDGAVPLDHLFAGGPDLAWEADIAWIIRGGADPFAWIREYGDRITAVHVKDIAPKGENADEDGWADVGHGIVPWADLAKALAGSPVRHFIVEHDNPKDIARLAMRSIATIKAF
ncbi:xylose isomerase [Shinella sp. SUS2]|uniref:sugar phosphate isomerase/epimerase family protein n=1 Tax=unclassified Shinella TaxID=2643062 RepID=UPI000682C8E6|nr:MULTISPECIES: sugar phosphate isomerase/epimerase [unclassified Shinella]KNY18028.1 xylose isomerase [Shinella sp. SUS2]KOC75592.1 xylose isomerase [Shinella sp. GWS1]